MKLAFLLTQSLDSPSGLGRYLPLSKELARRGHQVEIYALHPDFDSLQATSFEQEGVRVRYVAPMHVRKSNHQKRYYPAHQMVGIAAAATWQLSRAALATSADILYIGKPHPMNSLAGLAAKWLRRKRLLLDCDDYEAASGNFGAGWQRQVVAAFERKMPLQVSLVSTNTYFMRQKLISWGAPAERVFYLPNGVDHQRFRAPEPAKVAALRRQLQLEESKVVAYIGSMSLASHAVDLLLQAFVQVLAACPEAVLLLVGGGEDYERLQQQCRALGIGHAVRWVGRVPPEQAVDYYHLAHVSVDPVYDNDAARSRSPLKMFESWACGAPFVSSDIGDRRALAGTPPAALLTKPGDADVLGAAILQVINDPQLAAALRLRGLETVEAFYWDRLAENAEEFLQEFG
jgi:glycosyltransferase involved in cell wall biosynthesis